ncbi:hypothetical protein NQ317_017225 [Molorchus minor]|uniref:DUF5641 domain-containing protein n=1 Tax=Molorchus minor TaxID=1323400 RepID=A0ABQ9JHF3_9CUCU|nr:hypothetical protein NQ317_017225 [Molorchus minor]
MVDIVIYSNVYSHKKFKISCAILPEITCRLPQVKINSCNWNIPNDIQLADPTFTQPSDIDVLIGADLYYQLLCNGMIKLGPNLPTLVNTQLGWIIGGVFSQNLPFSPKIQTSVLSVNDIPTNSNSSIVLFSRMEETESIEKIVSKFWSIEELPHKITLSREDELAESIFLKTTKILENGSYQVDLPLKSGSENTKLDVAERNSSKFPLASQVLLEQCYMDDILGVADTSTELIQLYSDLQRLLNSSGFHLHKWCSNSEVLIDRILKENSLTHDIKFDDTPNKVLGLKWNPRTDEFCISIPDGLESKPPITKRKILSLVAQCYDPLGFLSLVVIRGKLLIQALWKMKLDWDTPITDGSLLLEWSSFIDNFYLLKTLKIPRYLFLSKDIRSIEFHGFADASMKAYAACVYIRAVYEDNSVSSRLLSSKSRVSPLKTVSLPRLELCATLLLSKLVEKLISVFKSRFSPTSVTLWSDSQIVLCWLKAHPSRWTVFVANRVAQVQEITSQFKWRYIKTELNPADLPTRGVPIQAVENCQKWWQGPDFLQDAKWVLPEDNTYSELFKPPEERKVTLVVSQSTPYNEFWTVLLNRFSKFSKLQRIIAYVLRFVYNLKSKGSKVTDPLSISELESSLRLIIKILQERHFSKPIRELSSNRFVSDKQLQKLSPFLDSEGFLRVGGRIANADISFDQKHPFLLPSHNYIVSLMLTQEHIRLGHAGAQTVLSNFRLRFWSLNGLREIKAIIRKCRWSLDYLNRLQNRPKWFYPSENLTVNSLVLLKEDNFSPLSWPLARIIEVFPGSDGKTRAVKLKTKDGIFVRSIVKVCPLPHP